MNETPNHPHKSKSVILVCALFFSGFLELQIHADEKMSQADMLNSAKINGRIEAILNGTADFALTPEDLIASAKIKDRVNGREILDKYGRRFSAERGLLISNLISIVKDSASYNLNQCSAAFYLGQMRAVEAVDSLSERIAVKFTDWGIVHVLPPNSDYFPFAENLVLIGSPAVPSLIRNLTQSDDAKVRELSLQVLARIDGDKDISQLRLQKALKAEPDSKKQARLQAALKSLSESKP